MAVVAVAVAQAGAAAPALADRTTVPASSVVRKVISLVTALHLCPALVAAAPQGAEGAEAEAVAIWTSTLMEE